MVPLLILLLTLQTLFSTPSAQLTPPEPAAVQTLQNLEASLSEARFARTCPQFKQSSLTFLTTFLSKTRECNYNGLPFPEYRRLREICQTRSELATPCQNGEPTACTRLRQAREACTAIGWTSPTRRACAQIAPLLASQERIAAMECPDPTAAPEETLEQLDARVREMATSIRRSVGLAPPAYALTVTEPLDGPATSVVILLHGVGRTVVDFNTQVAFARAMGFERTRFIAPQALNGTVELFPGPDRPSWFPLLPLDQPEAEEEVIEAATNVANIADIQHFVHGIPYDRIAVVGNSQGGGLALTSYLRFPFAGCVVVGGYLPIRTTYPAALSSEGADAPVLFYHGSNDEVIPVRFGRLSAEIVRGLGRNVTYLEFEDSHTLVASFEFTIERTALFLGDVLDE